MSGRIVAGLLWAAASLPALAWWLRRLSEPIGVDVAAWLVLPAIVRRHWKTAGKSEEASSASWLFSAAMLAASIVLRGFLPITVSAVFATLALMPLILPPRRQGGEFAIASIAMMAIPSQMIADLFLGLPLRFVATRLAAAIVASLGLSVGVEGTGISIDGSIFWVDVPCAGVQMLGSSMLLAFVLAAAFRLRFWRTVALASSAVPIAVVANTVRIAVLTLGQFFGYEISPAMHRWIGIAALIPGAALLAFLAVWLAKAKQGGENERGKTESKFLPVAKIVFLLTAIAGMAGFWTAAMPPAATAGGDGFPGWPAEFEGGKLVELGKNEFEADFGERFPGRIGKFRCGDNIVIIRWVKAPTHRAHSTSYCLRASGWRIEPLPLEIADHGAWTSCRAERKDLSLIVREQVRDADGKSIPDISSWFWQAFFSRTRGPWWIYSVVKRRRKEL